MASSASLQPPPEHLLRRAGVASRVLSVVGAALALGAIVFASYRIEKINAQVEDKQKELTRLGDAVKARQDELSETESKLNQANALLAFSQATYARIARTLPAGAAQEAIQQTAAADPQSANLPPVIYIHVASEEQRTRARQVQDQLRTAGYTVPGIEYVGAKAPQHSQLRYFVRTDEGPVLDKVLKLLRSSGLDVNEQFIRMNTGAPRALRPNQFELWFGQEYKPS